MNCPNPYRQSVFVLITWPQYFSGELFRHCPYYGREPHGLWSFYSAWHYFRPWDLFWCHSLWPEIWGFNIWCNSPEDRFSQNLLQLPLPFSFRFPILLIPAWANIGLWRGYYRIVFVNDCACSQLLPWPAGGWSKDLRQNSSGPRKVLVAQEISLNFPLRFPGPSNGSFLFANMIFH